MNASPIEQRSGMENDMSQTSDMIRKMFKEGDDKRDAGLVAPENILRYDNLAYGTDKDWQVLDVYRPKDADRQKLPVIVSVHGGGWVYGNKERYQFYCMELAGHGFAVVNFTYRLAPEFKYPAPIEDTNRVFAWVLAHAGEYAFDTEQIFAVGDSAGAHCLGLYAAICTNKEYAKCYDFKVPDDFQPKAIALNCGAYRIKSDGNIDELTVKLMCDYLPERGSRKELEQIDVINHITENYPPTFFMTAVDDFLRTQAGILEEKLCVCEVPFVYRNYGDMRNRLKHVFHLDIRTEDAKLCNREECEFFHSFCRI